jgi:hypothetical protein
LAEAVDVVGVAGDAGDDLGNRPPARRAPRLRKATTPLAPPIGMWSSQRGDTPKCCVRPMAVSGASVKLLTTRKPSTSALANPLASSNPRSARPIHQCALLGGVAHVRHRARHGHRDAFVARSERSLSARFFRSRVSMHDAVPGNDCAISLAAGRAGSSATR